MSDYVIKVDNLGKSYTLHHQHAERYTTLRDTLAHNLRNIGKHFGLQPRNAATPTIEEFWALKDVGFEVKQGERVGIIGRNGAGKSTLLKILSRITEPTNGRVQIRGRVASLLEVGTGFHPELTGRENIYLNGAILGMSRYEIQHKFDEIVAFAEVENFLDTPVKRYSSGMYVRLAFAVAAHLEPEILIVDEVLAVGDAAFQKKCLGKMRDVANEGRTVVFVSHNMGAILQLCLRGILINKGQLQLDGAMNQAVSEYLSIGLTQEGERRWVSLSEAPGSDVVRMCAIRVCCKNGSIKTNFTVRDLILIELEYQVLQECPLDAYIFLYNEQGVCIFVSIDNKDSPWHNTTRSPGMYRSTCQIPGDFLNNGQYTVSAYISQNLDKAVMHVAETDAVNFLVTDSTDEDGVRGNYRHSWPNAVIRPRLCWIVEQL